MHKEAEFLLIMVNKTSKPNGMSTLKLRKTRVSFTS
jgi:hypothetical protein